MFQRLQSLFLLLAAIIMGLLFVFPYAEVAEDDYFAQEYPVQTIFAAIVIIGSLGTIFLFRNRPLQIRISRMLLIFVAAFIVYAVYQLFQVNFEGFTFEKGALLPAFAAYCLARAMSQIVKDEKLVKGSDRLR